MYSWIRTRKRIKRRHPEMPLAPSPTDRRFTFILFMRPSAPTLVTQLRTERLLGERWAVSRPGGPVLSNVGSKKEGTNESCTEGCRGNR
jgi:hypothetical protein